MTLGGLILVLLAVGVVLAFFPVDGTIKNLILCVIVLAVLFAVFQGFNLGHFRFS